MTDMARCGSIESRQGRVCQLVSGHAGEHLASIGKDTSLAWRNDADPSPGADRDMFNLPWFDSFPRVEEVQMVRFGLTIP